MSDVTHDDQTETVETGTDEPVADKTDADEAVAEKAEAPGTGTDEAVVDETGTDEVAGRETTDALEANGPEEGPGRVRELENEGEIAADYLEELLDIADLDGDLDMDVDGDRAAVSIVGADLLQLVGKDGEVLDALQELTRLAVYRETGERSRLMLDVSGFRAEKKAELVQVAKSAIGDVQSSGERAALDPMTAFERKVVHDAVAAAGLVSESEGVEPRRYVVILPA